MHAGGVGLFIPGTKDIFFIASVQIIIFTSTSVLDSNNKTLHVLSYKWQHESSVYYKPGQKQGEEKWKFHMKRCLPQSVQALAVQVFSF